MLLPNDIVCVWLAGNFSRSILMAEKALRVMPREATLHADLAYSLVQAKRYNEAETHYKTAILLRPNTAVYHANFGKQANSIVYNWPYLYRPSRTK